MPAPRSFLVRLTLAGAAMLVAGLIAYVGLGWAVWNHAPWLTAHLSYWQFYYLERAYARALCGLLPGDGDSDGIRDGAEIFWRRDPASPNEKPNLFVEDFYVWDIREPSLLPDIIEYSPPASAVSIADLPKQCAAFQSLPGERCRGRAAMFAFSSFNSFFPRFAMADGWPIRFSPGEDSTEMVHFPGSTVQKNDHPSSELYPGSLVAKTSGGWVEFEFEIPSGAQTDLRKDYNLEATHAVQNDPVAGFRFRCVWRWTPQPPVVEKQEGASARIWSGETVYDRYQIFQLSWPAVDSRAEAIILEIARDEPDAAFVAVREYPSAETRCVLLRDFRDRDDGEYRGELKFRIVPISSARPQN